MFDKIEEIGSWWDWLTPVFAWILDLTRWPSHTFILHNGDMGGAWTEADLRRVMKQKGIQTWGEQIVDDVIMFTVRKRHKATVERILESTMHSKPPRRSLWARMF